MPATQRMCSIRSRGIRVRKKEKPRGNKFREAFIFHPSIAPAGPGPSQAGPEIPTRSSAPDPAYFGSRPDSGFCDRNIELISSAVKARFHIARSEKAICMGLSDVARLGS